jgi:osmotically-inducible protein OsmY
MRTDTDVQQDVLEELRWEPSLRNDDIAVAVREGVITLAGFVDSFLDKWKGERVASRVKGVKAVVNDLEVRLPTSSQRADPDIARAVLDALKWNVWVPDDRVRVKIEKGWVTLEGEADWYYEREEAERAARRITGLRGITNLITVRSRPTPSDVKQRIKDALERGADFDADRITVEVEAEKVVLRGTVRAYTEKRDAERAARNAPGVRDVDNRVTVDPTIPAPV